MKDTDHNQLLNKEALIKSFFPDHQRAREQDAASSQPHTEQIFVESTDILPYLQTIFFEEHFVEVQLDHVTRIFFAYMIDDDPTEGKTDEQITIVDSEQNREPGAYLKNMESLLLTPLSPGIGNAYVRASKQVLLRYFTGTVEVELGCHFQQQDVVQGIPVLRFAYPEICRTTKINRPYRVKIVSTVEAKIQVLSPARSDTAAEDFTVIDISVLGTAFQSQLTDTLFELGDNITLAIKVKNIKDLKVSGIVRRVTGLRNRSGYVTIYGVQFDLESRALAAEIEQMVSAIQRLHLRELANRMSHFRGVRIMR